MSLLNLNKFSLLDVIMAVLAGVALGIVSTRQSPELADVNPGWWIILVVAILGRHFYKLGRRGN
jgi:hypothetical protein